jgi:hypothetical protein
MFSTIFLSYGGKVPQGYQVTNLCAIVDTPQPKHCKIVAVLDWPWVEVLIDGQEQTSYVPRQDLRHITCQAIAPVLAEVMA